MRIGLPGIDPGTTTAHQPNWQMWADMVGQSVFQARAYVYTWVTAYDEEGPPSPPSVVIAAVRDKISQVNPAIKAELHVFQTEK